MNVTVVIPAHNAAPYLDETLVSIENQWFAPQEVIVIDDGSTDATAEVASKRGATVVTTPGLGAAAALNLGIAQSSTELIAHFDADDLMLPNKLKQQFDCFQAKQSDNLGLVSSDLQMFGSQGLDASTFLSSRLRQLQMVGCQDVLSSDENQAAEPHDVARQQPAPGQESGPDQQTEFYRWAPAESAKLLCNTHALDVKGLYRRTAWQEVGGFDSTYRCAYDMDFVWRISRRFDVALIPTVLFHGRRHEANISGNAHLVALECARLFEDMSRHRDGRNHVGQLRSRTRSELLDVAYIHRKRKRWIQSASFYWKAAWV